MEIEELIDSYLAGQATPDEARLVEAWYDQIDVYKGTVPFHRIAQHQQNTKAFLFNYIINSIDDDRQGIE